MSNKDKQRQTENGGGVEVVENNGGGHRNVLDRIFNLAGVVFEVADGKVYEQERGGIKSKKVARVIVPTHDGSIGVPGSVNLKQKGNGKPYLEFSFFGANMQTSVRPLDDIGKADLSDFRRRVAELYQTWRRGQAPASAPAVATAVAVADDLGFSAADLAVTE